jgi:hypothetical protein
LAAVLIFCMGQFTLNRFLVSNLSIRLRFQQFANQHAWPIV